MLLQGLILSLEIEVSVHQGLVRVVDSLKIGVLGSLIDFQAVEFGLQALQLRSELVSQVVLLTIFGQLLLLVFNENGIGPLKLVDLQIESMNHALQFRDIRLRLMDLDRSLLRLLGSLIQLLIE